MSETSATDPYRIQTPAADPLAPVEGGYFRYRRFLIVPRETELPHRCIRTGEHTGPEDWRKRKTLAFMPPVIWFGIVGNILLPEQTQPLGVIILFLSFWCALVFRKRASITYSLGPRARRRLRNGKISGIACFLGSISLSVFAFSNIIGRGATGNLFVSSSLFISAIILLVVGTALFLFTNSLRVVRHRKGWFQLKGASPAFLDTLPEADWRTL